MSPRIHVYTICWNESRVIEFFLRHYEQFAERIVIFDDASDDDTRVIAQANPKVELRRFIRSVPRSFELSKKAVLDHCWKEARGLADWVILVDVDEHVHHPNLRAYLAEQTRRGVTFIPTLGFHLISEVFPNRDEHLACTRTIGYGAPDHNKPVVFDPAAIGKLNIAVGQHKASPVGRVRLPEADEVMLLHYKYLSFEYLVERYKQLSPRVGPLDSLKSWDGHFHFTREELAGAWNPGTRPIIDISVPGFAPAQHSPKPYWRDRRWIRSLKWNAWKSFIPDSVVARARAISSKF